MTESEVSANEWVDCLPLARAAAAPGVWAAVLAEVPSLEADPAPLPPAMPPTRASSATA